MSVWISFEALSRLGLLEALQHAVKAARETPLRAESHWATPPFLRDGVQHFAVVGVLEACQVPRPRFALFNAGECEEIILVHRMEPLALKQIFYLEGIKRAFLGSGLQVLQ